ncbi:MAG TPA: hypothetical protein VHC22_09295 [Pirellulales bacterium]|nr:hypothetical protein [Pirellulales bacterium]
MSFFAKFRFGASTRSIRRRSKRMAAPAKRRLGFSGGGAIGMELLEMRGMLSGIPVTVDCSGATGPCTIDVGTSGSNTVISVNGTDVFDGASTSIGSLSITGSNYNDTISFDFTAGNPVPDADVSVNGGGGTNTLTADASQTFYLLANDLLVGSTSIQTQNVTDAVLTAAGTSQSTTVQGWVGNATVDLASSSDSVTLWALSGSTTNGFTAYPTTSLLSGTNYSYTTNGVGTISANGNGNSDLVELLDQGATNTTVFMSALVGSSMQGTVNGESYTVNAYGFPGVEAVSYSSTDSAELDDNGFGGSDTGSMNPTDSYIYGHGFSDTALDFPVVNMYAYYNSDGVGLNDSGTSGNGYTHATSASFQGPGYDNTAHNFGTMTLASYNSSDTAYMDDQGASGASNFYSNNGNSYWQGSAPSGSYIANAIGFKTIYSEAYNANDYAWYTDTAGGAYMEGYQGIDMIYGNGTSVHTVNFGSAGNPHISANAALPPGQYDVAQSLLKSYVVFYGNWIFE